MQVLPNKVFSNQSKKSLTQEDQDLQILEQREKEDNLNEKTFLDRLKLKFKI